MCERGAWCAATEVTESVALPLMEQVGLRGADAEHRAAVKVALGGLPLSAADKYPAS
ncbi:ABC transporter ATP-binding protein, partial [Pseudomonas ogarae]